MNSIKPSDIAMKDVFDIEGLLKMLFTVFFFNNWLLLVVSLAALFLAPVLLFAYAMLRGIAFLYPEMSGVVWAGGIVIVLMFLSVPVVRHRSVMNEGNVVAQAEHITAQNRFRAHQIYQLSHRIGQGAEGYSSTGRVDLDQVREAARQQIELLNLILDGSRSRYRYQRITQAPLRQRFQRAIEENREICHEMRAVRDSAERVLAIL